MPQGVCEVQMCVLTDPNYRKAWTLKYKDVGLRMHPLSIIIETCRRRG